MRLCIGVQDGHHVRIKNLRSEEAVVAALLVSLRARTRARAPVPRKLLQPVTVNHAIPVQGDREYVNRYYTGMPVDYGRHVYGQPGGNGGPESPLGDWLVRILVSAAVRLIHIGNSSVESADECVNIDDLLRIQGVEICVVGGARPLSRYLAGFSGPCDATGTPRDIWPTLVRRTRMVCYDFDVRRLAYSDAPVDDGISRVQTVGTNISEKVGDFARETLSFPTELPGVVNTNEGALETARKE